MIFGRIKYQIITMEVILDALITILHRKRVVTKDEIQREILEVALRNHNNKGA